MTARMTSLWNRWISAKWNIRTGSSHYQGPALSNALVNDGLCTFQKLEEANPRDIELIVNRHPPFGSLVHDAVAGLPKYELLLDQMTPYTAQTAEVVISIQIANKDALERPTADKAHQCCLLVGNADNNVLFKVRISDAVLMRGAWSKKLQINRCLKGEEIKVHFISQDWVGLDIESTYTPVYTGPKRVLSNQRRGEMMPANEPVNTEEPNIQPPLPEGRIPCNHRCKNKLACCHDCCSNGIAVRCNNVEQNRRQMHNKLAKITSNRKNISLCERYSYTPNKKLKMQRAPVKSPAQADWEELDLHCNKQAAVHTAPSPAFTPLANEDFQWIDDDDLPDLDHSHRLQTGAERIHQRTNFNFHDACADSKNSCQGKKYCASSIMPIEKNNAVVNHNLQVEVYPGSDEATWDIGMDDISDELQENTSNENLHCNLPITSKLAEVIEGDFYSGAVDRGSSSLKQQCYTPSPMQQMCNFRATPKTGSKKLQTLQSPFNTPNRRRYPPIAIVANQESSCSTPRNEMNKFNFDQSAANTYDNFSSKKSKLCDKESATVTSDSSLNSNHLSNKPYSVGRNYTNASDTSICTSSARFPNNMNEVSEKRTEFQVASSHPIMKQQAKAMAFRTAMQDQCKRKITENRTEINPWDSPNVDFQESSLPLSPKQTNRQQKSSDNNNGGNRLENSLKSDNFYVPNSKHYSLQWQNGCQKSNDDSTNGQKMYDCVKSKNKMITTLKEKENASIENKYIVEKINPDNFSDFDDDIAILDCDVINENSLDDEKFISKRDSNTKVSFVRQNDYKPDNSQQLKVTKVNDSNDSRTSVSDDKMLGKGLTDQCNNSAKPDQEMKADAGFSECSIGNLFEQSKSQDDTFCGDIFAGIF